MNACTTKVLKKNAKSIAIAKGQVYSVQFNASTESYSVKDQTGSTITHPVNKGDNYTVTFGTGSTQQVGISSVSFESTNEVKFDYLGTPLDSSNGRLSNAGIVTLEADGQTMTIRVEPITGYISIL